jgi:hypothetical protein
MTTEPAPKQPPHILPNLFDQKHYQLRISVGLMGIKHRGSELEKLIMGALLN